MKIYDEELFEDDFILEGTNSEDIIIEKIIAICDECGGFLKRRGIKLKTYLMEDNEGNLTDVVSALVTWNEFVDEKLEDFNWDELNEILELVS